MTANALTRKLDRWALLSDADHAALEGIALPAKAFVRHQRLIRQGEKPEGVFLLVEGWAVRHKDLPDGRRQIVGFLVPGDLCDIHVFLLAEMDHGISMLSPGKVVEIPTAAMTTLMDRHPAIARTLFWTTLVDEATLREWLVNVTTRDAYARVAHIVCEIHGRLRNVGLITGDVFELPLTQIELGEAVGLTSVHINRTLRRLREDGLFTLRDRQMTIHDLAMLKRAAGFDPTYLHARARP